MPLLTRVLPALAITLSVAGVASADPPPAINLGTLAPPGLTLQGPFLVARTIRWYRFTIPAIAPATGRFLDITTAGSAMQDQDLYPNDDTVIGLYDAAGARIVFDDNDGPGSTSQITFGATAPARPPVGNGLPGDGRDGSLAAGTYFLALGAGGSVMGPANFSASNNTLNSGTPRLVLNLGTVCRADFDGNNAVSVQDIFDFLNAWFALDPRADFNGMNGITPQDIFDFLNAWFAGC